MLKYLVVQLDDTSVSFCHYKNDKTKPCIIELDTLKKALFWAMKENLNVQFIYPDYKLSSEYKEVILGVDHTDIVCSTCEDTVLRKNADVVVFDSWAAINHYKFSRNQSYVIRTTFDDLFTNGAFLNVILPKVSRLNIVITDVESFDQEKEAEYTRLLENLSVKIYEEYKNNHCVQLNILTDRILLDSMNNCGAGDESITIAPNGKFYICPGFYADGAAPVGDVENGLDVKNPQLYKLSHAPICRICDAYQCRRCIWLNRKMTLEVNTPSREQCVMAHIERNASRNLLGKLRSIGEFLPGKEIKELDYLDPFDELIKNN